MAAGPRRPSLLTDQLQNRFRAVERVRVKIETLVSIGTVRRHEAEMLYCGLYVDSIVSFERFVEELFIGYLTCRYAAGNGVTQRVIFRSDTVARDIVFGGRKYVDWFPFESQTVKRAEAFFRGGRPFSSLDRQDMSLLDQALLIRNAIAHKSHHAISAFQRRVIAGRPLTTSERMPGGYLRGQFRANPPQSRFENLVIELLNVAIKLAA